MREIAAASDFDFVALEPRRARKGAASKAVKGQKNAAPAKSSQFAVVWRYRTPAFGALLLGGLLVAIVVNAMFLQHGHHPAPLFGATFRIAPPAPPHRPAPLEALLNEAIPQGALKPVDPAPAAAFAAPVVGETAPAAAEAPQRAPAAAPPAKKTHDLIGALIADNGVVTPAMRGGHGGAHAVLSAQKALEKLGMAVKADGDFGAATRRAVEAFQRQNHLPVTGELNARTRHALSARSGLRVE
ncbi:peptidoglycan-binding protein [Rhodoblastus acidophilus]|uniref:Peptidoglycan-binding protein n=1 Tax=Candidatus Rhodoblastus alkanivorans TaxID=2954117 RepID=A0ABS9Z899_9HYPH|nr:peptidoglycan-binding domain-containing protein [Candidatus Rhodoblastus alkanivorans]MCI4677978.1 peptidoglycan-binding protein [Candidatus Rhodoblastus alkanivorans]MCI4683873.1 peptidoglycan-binding protein [Candidatus Rhodoblastus alkanivorans]MDI4641191.1 peptidoglycan-binding protein [Rhodoblastus acidophilus]